jgi:hypothetical protein
MKSVAALADETAMASLEPEQSSTDEDLPVTAKDSAFAMLSALGPTSKRLM